MLINSERMLKSLVFAVTLLIFNLEFLLAQTIVLSRLVPDEVFNTILQDDWCGKLYLSTLSSSTSANYGSDMRIILYIENYPANTKIAFTAEYTGPGAPIGAPVWESLNTSSSSGTIALCYPGLFNSGILFQKTQPPIQKDGIYPFTLRFWLDGRENYVPYHFSIIVPPVSVPYMSIQASSFADVDDCRASSSLTHALTVETMLYVCFSIEFLEPNGKLGIYLTDNENLITPVVSFAPYNQWVSYVFGVTSLGNIIEIEVAKLLDARGLFNLSLSIVQNGSIILNSVDLELKCNSSNGSLSSNIKDCYPHKSAFQLPLQRIETSPWTFLWYLRPSDFATNPDNPYGFHRFDGFEWTTPDWKNEPYVTSEAEIMQDVQASAAGVVLHKTECTVAIDHGGGWVTYYSKITNIAVQQGQSVTARQRLGRISTVYSQSNCDGKNNNLAGPRFAFYLRWYDIGMIEDAEMSSFKLNTGDYSGLDTDCTRANLSNGSTVICPGQALVPPEPVSGSESFPFQNKLRAIVSKSKYHIRPSPAPTPEPTPSPTPEGATPVPTPVQNPAPTPQVATPAPTPEGMMPVPTPEEATPEPTPQGATPAPTPELTPQGATPATTPSLNPAPTPSNPTPAPTPSVVETDLDAFLHYHIESGTQQANIPVPSTIAHLEARLFVAFFLTLVVL